LILLSFFCEAGWFLQHCCFLEDGNMILFIKHFLNNQLLQVRYGTNISQRYP